MPLYSFEGEELRRLKTDQYSEERLEDWLERNPRVLVDDEALLIVGRQVPTEAGPIDLLALNGRGDLIVIELKRGRTPRETIAQALDYLSVVEDWDTELIEAHASEYRRSASTDWRGVAAALADIAQGSDENDEANAQTDEIRLNARQHVVIAAREITSPLRRIANLLNRKGLSIRCVEFSRYVGADGTALANVNTVVAQESGDGPVRTKWTRDSFLEQLRSALEDEEEALGVVQRLLEFAEHREQAGEAVLRTGTGKMGTLTYRAARPEGQPVSVFGLSIEGQLGVFYGSMSRKADAQAYDEFLRGLGGLSSFHDIRERIAAQERGFGMQLLAVYDLRQVLSRPGELDEFLRLVDRYGSSIRGGRTET